MKIGDIVEINTGHTGLIVAAEYMYPGHPQSPIRHIDVLWSAGQPHHAFGMNVNKGMSRVNAFAVKKVISHGED